MKDVDLRPNLRAKMATRKRVRGRYNSSEFYAITHGWVTPEQWINPAEKTMKELMVMWNGIAMHGQIEELLDKEFSEIKREITYKGITLVGKVDYLPPHLPDDVWEFKTSEKTMEKMKPWAEHQIKLYCSMFNKKRGHVYQPVKNADGLYLKHLGMVERDDKWFEAEMNKLYGFHLKVEKLWELKK
jgi:hypothetical protein